MKQSTETLDTDFLTMNTSRRTLKLGNSREIYFTENQRRPLFAKWRFENLVTGMTLQTL